ncbi:DUF4333 domain-containing protein [Streptomyces sp. NPDC059452]|uniref:DUF4333 domain-containing protein n=1 Tax=Streptomyces sp. NPDC059452 TaxID=3346835 RepID=UPI0036C7341B
MNIFRPSAAAWSLSAVAAAALLVGCSGSITVGNSEPKLSSDALASTVSKKLAESTGQPEPDVTCPEDLVGKLDTTTRCTLTAGDGSTVGVTVTVTSVVDDRINFDIKADDTATPAPN